MKIIEKYKELINSQEITEYIGNSARRKFLVKGITVFAISLLTVIAIILALVIVKVLFSYFS